MEINKLKKKLKHPNTKFLPIFNGQNNKLDQREGRHNTVSLTKSFRTKKNYKNSAKLIFQNFSVLVYFINFSIYFNNKRFKNTQSKSSILQIRRLLLLFEKKLMLLNFKIKSKK